MTHEMIEHGTIKVVELIGVSEKSFEDAVSEAVKRASQKLHHITGVEVLKFTAKVDGNALTEFHANLKLAFIVT